MKSEASTLSTAILLISAGDSVTHVLKIIGEELREFGIAPLLGVVSSAKLECRLEGNDLNIDVSDRVGDVKATMDLAISTLAIWKHCSHGRM